MAEKDFAYVHPNFMGPGASRVRVYVTISTDSDTAMV